MFNVDNGYLEGLVRGFRSGIMSRADYLNLVQCETIEGMLIGAISRSRGVWESYEQMEVCALYETPLESTSWSFEFRISYCVHLVLFLSQT